MKCPYCLKSETRVIDSRLTNESSIRRRRECEKCNKRFTTYERVETSEVYVIKKDGRRENFDRDKLFKGIMISCEKRPVKLEKINQTVEKIETDIINLGRNEIRSKTIGELVMHYLKQLDDVAYVRFASVYRRFKDISQFKQEIENMQKPEAEILVKHD